MNPEIQKEIQTQLDSLPKKVREIIASIDITNEIANLRSKHHLMLDQIATLELETMLVMIGLEPADNFVKNLESSLKIDESKAVLIANDLNELIFQKIRHAMMEEIGDQKSEGDLDKDKILAEIENPTPTFPKAEIVANSTPKTILPEIAPSQTIQKYTVPTQTQNIVEQKLTKPTHIEPKETEISLKKIPQTTKTSISEKKPAFDPYKEPLD